jgi:hypothetical protein
MQHRSLLLGAAVALAWLAAFGASGAINNGLPLAKGKYFDRVFIVLLENQAYIEYAPSLSLSLFFIVAFSTG